MTRMIFRWNFLCATLVAAAVSSSPRSARACGDPTLCGVGVTNVIGRELPVPSDGVFSFFLAFDEATELPPTADAILGVVSVQVFDDQQVPVSGSLMWVEQGNLLVWRPDSPLAPGAYTATVTIDNAEEATVGSCSEPAGDFQATFDVTVVPGTTPPWAPALTVDSLTWSTEVVERLDTLVCCDGAFPEFSAPSCDDAERIWWSQGYCTPAVESSTGVLAFNRLLPPSPEADSQYLALFQPAGGEPTPWHVFRVLEPTCYTPVLLDLRDGSLTEGEPLCITEDDIPMPLGEFPLDPSAELEEQCVGDPYTCRVVGSWWSESDCVPWSPPPDDSTTTGTEGGGDTDSTSAGGTTLGREGCACTSTSGGGSGGPGFALAGLVAGLLRRRRRR